MNSKSKKLFEEAKKLIPGGVNSPVRAFGAVGSEPIFIQRASGSKIYDIDDREYIDYVMSWGPMILGHAHPIVTASIIEQSKLGTSYGAPTAYEVEMARLLVEAIPSMEKVRLVNSGTEAVMTAVRLARAFTNREKILKFEGCYHGHSDSLLSQAGSGMATLGIPTSPGVPSCLAEKTITVPYNNIEMVEHTLRSIGEEVAAIIVEPVAGNMGVVPPRANFLNALRNFSDRYGIVLIFDEVITGFRFTFGGYQNIIGIEPDLTCLGKIIGGGLPIGAVGGKMKIMDLLAPEGPVYQAGTLSGNPLATAAGTTTLNILKENAPYYDLLNRNTFSLCYEMEEIFREAGVPVTINREGSMFTIFFTDKEVFDHASARSSNTELFGRFFRGMIKHGINIPPSQFEAWFLSFAHDLKDRDRTLEACRLTLKDSF
ncbi:MAG: glutamate-1-semialdehyde 2,1-aminomutase [Syntrophales bacterium]|nr:glutamate-1-semialdehyde 2,1-aminomutase [Syntrophales bacterium]